MRTGKIVPETVELRIDRGHETLPLWEEGAAEPLDLPWWDAANPNEKVLEGLLRTARSAVLVLGATPSSTALLGIICKNLGVGTRLYIYADRALEPDSAFMREIGARPDQILVRLGHQPPGDWFVVDQGESGVLLIGPEPRSRRWMIPVGHLLARTLFEAFRALFWFHATREALPDAAGKLAWRAPLAAPALDPGTRLALPAGVLCIGEGVTSPVLDADLRLAPVPSDPGRAGIIVIPPRAASAAGPRAQVDIELPRRLTRRGSRVVWFDSGMPATALTRERMVMDLVAPPIALQLEWPKVESVDILHRLIRATDKPAWTFHDARRLDAVRGAVLVHGADSPASIELVHDIRVEKEVIAALDHFDSAAPSDLPPPSPLAKAVLYRWSRVPEQRPPGAKRASLVQQWTSVDEWARRQCDQIEDALKNLEHGDQSVIGRLKRWMRGGRETAIRAELGAGLRVLAEVAPSQDPEGARRRIDDLVALAARVREFSASATAQAQEAEDKAAEAEQRSAWTKQHDEAIAAADAKRKSLAENRANLTSVMSEIESVDRELQDISSKLREAHRTGLIKDLERLNETLKQAESELDLLTKSNRDKTPKDEKKRLGTQLHNVKQALQNKQKELDRIESWQPAPAEFGDAWKRREELRGRVHELERDEMRIEGESLELTRRADQVFVFQSPIRLVAPVVRDAGQAPSVPSEAPPELGELWEHERRRYLEIVTWEQLESASQVARRLDAVLVARRS